MENREIRQHPLGIPTSGDVFLFQSLQDLKTKRVPVDQFLPSSTSLNIEWTSQKATDGDYDTDSIVSYEGNLYQSNIDDNGVLPGTDNTKWELLTKGKSGLIIYSPGVFIEDEVFTLFQIVDAIYLFRLKSETRPFVSSDFLAEYADDDWELVGLVQVIEVNTAGEDVTFNHHRLQKINFYGSADIDEDKEFLFSGLIAGTHSFSRIGMGGTHVITFPEGTKMSNTYNAEWSPDTRQWQPLEAGQYEMELTYINEVVHVKMHGPLT